MNYLVSNRGRGPLSAKVEKRDIMKGMKGSEGVSVLVGAHGSGLYAIPNDYFMMDFSKQVLDGKSVTDAWLLGCCIFCMYYITIVLCRHGVLL